MESVVAQQEPLARFIFSSGHFSRETSRVKHNAFLPTPAGEASVFRVEALPEADIWNIGKGIALRRRQTLYARGDILAAQVREAGLQVKTAEPPPRHANIVGWPSEKHAQKVQAMHLAGKAKLLLPA